MESGRWVAESLEKKSQAVAARSPQLVILGGSSSHFGLSARRLSAISGIETVNAASHAGLGINYIMYYGKKFLAADRLFVLPLEYELYGTTSNESAYQQQVIGFDPAYFRNLPAHRKLSLLTRYSIEDWARMGLEKVHPHARIEAIGYQARTIDAWGDETANLIQNRTPAMLAASRVQHPKHYSIDDAAWRELENFVAQARQAGSRVVLAYPAIHTTAFDAALNRDFFAELQRRASRLGIPVAGHPEEHVFNDAAAFDTLYHQNSLGQVTSTDRLYNDLIEIGALPPVPGRTAELRTGAMRACRQRLQTRPRSWK